jgi:nucleotide-binding universal stress UspA family protein
MSRRPAALYRSILCPVDFSPGSRAALKLAHHIARRFDARLTVMYADDPMLAAAAAAGYDRRALSATSLRELRRLVQRVLGVDERDDGVAFSVSFGRPAEAIIKTARTLEPDLIVMGTHGLSGAKRMMFGSTTSQVLRKTGVPVLAAPQSTSTARWPGPRVVAALELGPHARSDASAAARVARAFGVPLRLVHVVAPTQTPPWRQPQLESHDRTRLVHARSALAALAAGTRDVDVDMRVLLGDPAEEIAAAAEDAKAGLIVMTLRRGRGLFGARQGSITYRVLCGAGAPVLALREASAGRRGSVP